METSRLERAAGCEDVTRNELDTLEKLFARPRQVKAANEKCDKEETFDHDINGFHKDKVR